MAWNRALSLWNTRDKPTRNPSTASRRMLRTLKIAGQSRPPWRACQKKNQRGGRGDGEQKPGCSHFPLSVIPSTQSGSAAECDDDCIRVIVGEDFAEVRALFGHCPGPGLAESDTVSLADSSQNGLLAFF
jgi:hypothetical protein